MRCICDIINQSCRCDIYNIMRKLTLTFPNQIIDQLELLCENAPKICKKESQLGWSTNDRILFVRDKYLEYYNLHPGFIENDPSTLRRRYFKACVRLDAIYEVNYLPKNKIKKNFLEVVFPQKKKLLKIENPNEANPTEEEVQLKRQEESQKLEKWLFEFDYDVKELIEKEKETRKELKRNHARLESQIKESRKLSTDSEKSTPKRKKKSKVNSAESHQENIEEYVSSMQKTKNLLKQKAEQQNEELERLKSKREKQLAERNEVKVSDNQEDIFVIASHWREYFKVYDVASKYKNLGIKNIDNELNVLHEVEYFKTISIKIVQQYVDDRICGYNPIKPLFENFFYYEGVWLQVGGKELNQRFLANYYLNDIIYSVNEIKNFKIRIPLMIFVKYKGFKVLCMANMPFNEIDKSEIYNLNSDVCDLQLMGKLKECFQIYEDILNIKTETVNIDNKKKILAPLGQNLKVYEYQPKKDKKKEEIYTLSNFYYLLHVGQLFPLDYNSQKQALDRNARLRPQVVALYREYHQGQDCYLLSQAFMQSDMTKELKEQEDIKAIKASNLIVNVKIAELLQKLNSLQLMFIDSLSIKLNMEEMGINMRYLYLIYDNAELPYLRELVSAQAVARTIKKEFRQTLRDILNQSLGAKKSRLDRFENNPQERKEYLREKRKEENSNYQLIALDYLNLIFGCGKETDAFWKIIIDKCFKYYKIKIDYPIKIKPGCLLNAVLWSCQLKLLADTDLQLFKTEYPFKNKQDIFFDTRYETFDFSSFEIQKMFKKIPDIGSKDDMQEYKRVSMQLLKLQLLFNRTLHLLDYRTQITLSKLNNYQQYIDKPKAIVRHHPSELPHFISNKSHHNFQKALEIMKFSLPDTHPIFISLYLEYAELIDPDLLKKSALLMAIKALGEFHYKTTEIYTMLYNQGYSQHKIKAQRVQTIIGCEVICTQMFQNQMYESCLNYTLEQIQKIKEKNPIEKLGANNYQKYLKILMEGLESSIKTNRLNEGLHISKQVSFVMSSFKVLDFDLNYEVLRKTLIIHLLKSQKKYFLYKMVLFAIHITSKHQKNVKFDVDQSMLPCSIQDRKLIMKGIISQYPQKENHSDWIAYIIGEILKSFNYFNYLEDLFFQYKHHIKRYGNEEFIICLGYFDILIRLYGQSLFKGVLYDIKLS